MEERNLPAELRNNSNPLWLDIKKFSANKFHLAILLVLIGLLGVIIPVIPGILFFLFAIDSYF